MANVVEVDASTGTVTVRDMTPEEVAQRTLDAAADLERAAAAEQAEAERFAAREAAVTRFRSLGFTESEIAVLVLP